MLINKVDIDETWNFIYQIFYQRACKFETDSKRYSKSKLYKDKASRKHVDTFCHPFNNI